MWSVAGKLKLKTIIIIQLVYMMIVSCATYSQLHLIWTSQQYSEKWRRAFSEKIALSTCLHYNSWETNKIQDCPTEIFSEALENKLYKV